MFPLKYESFIQNLPLQYRGCIQQQWRWEGHFHKKKKISHLVGAISNSVWANSNSICIVHIVTQSLSLKKGCFQVHPTLLVHPTIFKYSHFSPMVIFFKRKVVVLLAYVFHFVFSRFFPVVPSSLPFKCRFSGVVSLLC